jgi:hypothetical protein
MVSWLLNGALDWLAVGVQGVLSWLVALLTSRLFTTPDVTVFPQVQALAARSSLVVDAGFGLAVIAAGVIGMTYGSVQIRYHVKDLLPRLAFAFVASNFGVQACSALIALANAVTVALVGQAASGPRVIAYVRHQIVASVVDPGVHLLQVIIVLVIVIFILQLLAGWFSRIATLLVLGALAPIALACYALPQTQPAAQLWWRALLVCLAVPLLQGIAFSAGVDLILDPAHSLSTQLGAPGPVIDMFNLFLVLCLLVTTVRIPRLVARYATQRGAAMSPVGLIVRTVLVQSVARRVPGARSLVR